MATYNKVVTNRLASNQLGVAFNKLSNSIYGTPRIGEKDYAMSTLSTNQSSGNFPENLLALGSPSVNPNIGVNGQWSIVAVVPDLVIPANSSYFTRNKTEKVYELTNHLG